MPSGVWLRYVWGGVPSRASTNQVTAGGTLSSSALTTVGPKKSKIKSDHLKTRLFRNNGVVRFWEDFLIFKLKPVSGETFSRIFFSLRDSADFRNFTCTTSIHLSHRFRNYTSLIRAHVFRNLSSLSGPGRVRKYFRRSGTLSQV